MIHSRRGSIDDLIADQVKKVLSKVIIDSARKNLWIREKKVMNDIRREMGDRFLNYFTIYRGMILTNSHDTMHSKKITIPAEFNHKLDVLVDDKEELDYKIQRVNNYLSHAISSSSNSDDLKKLIPSVLHNKIPEFFKKRDVLTDYEVTYCTERYKFEVDAISELMLTQILLKEI